MNIETKLAAAICTHIASVSSVPPLAYDSSEDLPLPYLVVTCEEGEEHDVLAGVYTVDCAIRYATAPEDTTQEDHRAEVMILHGALADYSTARMTLDALPGIRVFDIRNLRTKTEPEDQARVTTITFTATAASTD